MHKFKGSNINFAPDFTHHCLNINHDIKSLFSVHPRVKKVATLFLAKTAATFGLFVHSWRASHLLPRFVVRDQWIMHKFTLQSYLATLIWPSLCGSRTVWPLSKDQNPPFLCTWCQVQKKYSHSQTRSALRPIVFAKFGRADGKSDDVGNRKTIRATHFSLVFFLPFLFSLKFLYSKKKKKCVFPIFADILLLSYLGVLISRNLAWISCKWVNAMRPLHGCFLCT